MKAAASPALELVVARHRENLRWLRRVPPGFVVTVYDKSGDPGAVLPLPNHGREAHTWLHHLVHRRDHLAERTVFVQGHPFDHAPDLHHWLRSLASDPGSLQSFHWLGFVCDTDDARGRRLFVPWTKNPSRQELDLEGFHQRIFGEPGPREYRFFPGGQFAVHRETVLRRPPGFYEQALRVSLEHPEAAHCFERCWDRLFDCDGTAGRADPGALTSYFKPIRRLGGGRAGAPGHPGVPP